MDSVGGAVGEKWWNAPGRQIGDRGEWRWGEMRKSERIKKRSPIRPYISAHARYTLGAGNTMKKTNKEKRTNDRLT
jgi:hypothetical protein